MIYQLYIAPQFRYTVPTLNGATSAMKTLADYKPGDVLIFTQRSKRGGVDFVERRVAMVTVVDYKGCGMVTYAGFRWKGYEDLLPTGASAFDPAKVGTTPYGFHCAVEKIASLGDATKRYAGPRPGDRGYDLMC